MNTALHRTGATIAVAIGLIGAFGGLVRGAPRADAAPAATAVHGERIEADVDLIVDAAAEAMGSVTSVRFDVERMGEPVHIDPIESLAVDRIVGRFQTPGNADAIVTVTIDGELTTDLGAVALGPDVWLSNPITGLFEPLPPGYNIDPTRFFDPAGGWQPLLAGLADRTLVGDGDTHHVQGTASAGDLHRVSAGLVAADGVVIDLWIHPYTASVERIEFSVPTRDGVSDWTVVLTDYGVPFEIIAPVDRGDGS